MKKCTSKQLEIIYTLFRELGWNDFIYGCWLKSYYQVNRAEDLAASQAVILIKSLQNIQADQKRNREGGVTMISTRQSTYLKSLWLDVDYSAGDSGDKHLSAFLDKRFKVKKVCDLTCKQAIACIYMIKRLISQSQVRKGKTTILNKKSHCRYCGKLILWVQLADGRRMPFDFDGNDKATDFHECDKINKGYAASR